MFTQQEAQEFHGSSSMTVNELGANFFSTKQPACIKLHVLLFALKCSAYSASSSYLLLRSWLSHRESDGRSLEYVVSQKLDLHLFLWSTSIKTANKIQIGSSSATPDIAQEGRLIEIKPLTNPNPNPNAAVSPFELPSYITLQEEVVRREHQRLRQLYQEMRDFILYCWHERNLPWEQTREEVVRHFNCERTVEAVRSHYRDLSRSIPLSNDDGYLVFRNDYDLEPEYIRISRVEKCTQEPWMKKLGLARRYPDRAKDYEWVSPEIRNRAATGVSLINNDTTQVHEMLTGCSHRYDTKVADE